MKPQWSATVNATIAWQWGLVLALAGLAWGLAGTASAVSLLCGGGAVAVPNALLALGLWAKSRRVGLLGAPTFLIGECLKLLATVGLLVLTVAWLSSDVVWPAIVVGMIGALKAQWFALWSTRNSA